jgi:hypothetical protein
MEDEALFGYLPQTLEGGLYRDAENTGVPLVTTLLSVSQMLRDARKEH